jgi:hypothetical protein
MSDAVRLEPVLVELEREQEDLLIIGHASVIRCLLAYLIGLPASEIPAIEVARGDLIEVTPTSYGVRSQAFHFWDGPGRRGDGPDDPGTGKDENNFYENYAGKPSPCWSFEDGVLISAERGHQRKEKAGRDRTTRMMGATVFFRMYDSFDIFSRRLFQNRTVMIDIERLRKFSGFWLSLQLSMRQGSLYREDL